MINLAKSYHYNLNATSWTCEAFSPIAKAHFSNSYSDLISKYSLFNTYLKTNIAQIPAYKSSNELS